MNRQFWDYLRTFGNLPRFIRRYEEVIYGRNSSDDEHCIKNHRQNVAIVNIQIATSANDLINKIVKTPRVTTADILSNIGKYIYNHKNIFLILFHILSIKCSLSNSRWSYGSIYRI